MRFRYLHLIQVMACRKFGMKPLTEIMLRWLFITGAFRNKLQMNTNQNTGDFIQENAYHDVIYKLSTIFG